LRVSKVLELHREAAQIYRRLKEEQISSLFHFSSVENLQSICRSTGLHSKASLEAEGQWPCPIPGGNALSHSLDRQNRNWDKISLNFTPYTPMAYWKKREQHLCFFLVSTKVAGWQGVVFTDSNAAGTGDQRRGEGIEGLENVNFDAIRSAPRPWDRPGWVRPVQAEALVPNQIPFEYIDEVAFVSQASRRYAELLVGSLGHPPFVTREVLFADGPTGSQQTIGYSHVVDCYVTDEKIMRENVALPRSHKTQFVRSATPQITLILLLRTTAGAQVVISLLPSGLNREISFGASKELHHWGVIPMDKLQDGKNELKISLNGVCWSALQFEIVGR
jgi:hypothetical protein